jgi:hypothetical protein
MSGKNKPGGAKKDFTRRDIAIAFVVFFSVFFAVGYLRGRSDRSSPDRLKLYLGEIIHADKNLLKFGKENGKTVIRYACPSNQYWYDVDVNKTYKDLHNTGGTTESAQLAITKDGAFYTAFIAGTISAWSIKDVLAFVTFGEGGTTSSRVKVVMAAIAGTVIGYEVGYWLATRTAPACDDANYANLLQDPKEWESIEEAVWRERFKKLYEENSGFSSCGAKDANVRHVEDEKLSTALTKLEQLKLSASEVGYNYSAADFDALDEFAKVRSEYIGLCLNQGAAAN